MNETYYLICLTGIDSLQLNLVDEETFNWVIDGEDIPDSVKEDLLESRDMSEEELENWISQHTENDRALFVTALENFYSVFDLIEHVKKNNITIADEYRGLIY